MIRSDDFHYFELSILDEKILMLLISPVIAGSVYSAEDWSKKPQSYVFLQNEEP